LIHQAEFKHVVGHENISANVQEALQRAEAVFEKIEAKAVAQLSTLPRSGAGADLASGSQKLRSDRHFDDAIPPLPE